MTINKTNNKQDVTSEFLYKGKWITDNNINAECMNQYLANIGKETNESVGSAKFSSSDYLKKHLKRNETAILSSEVSMDEVVEVCKNLNPERSTDPSGFQQSIVHGTLLALFMGSHPQLWGVKSRFLSKTTHPVIFT
jgi:hypothetical protein